jgi:hypothetical protein
MRWPNQPAFLKNPVQNCALQTEHLEPRIVCSQIAHSFAQKIAYFTYCVLRTFFNCAFVLLSNVLVSTKQWKGRCLHKGFVRTTPKAFAARLKINKPRYHSKSLHICTALYRIITARRLLSLRPIVWPIPLAFPFKALLGTGWSNSGGLSRH